jgi:hypothetical protein
MEPMGILLRTMLILGNYRHLESPCNKLLDIEDGNKVVK